MINPTEQFTQLSSEYFTKCSNLQIIQQPFLLSAINEQLSNRDLQNQFQLIRALTQTKRHKMRLRSNNVFQNKKNRYPQQAIYDHSRIVLSKQHVQSTNQQGYINANSVIGIDVASGNADNNFLQKLILTQGPIQSSIKDLHRLIKQQDIQCVVMLCRLIEGGKNRCHDYLQGLSVQEQTKIEQYLQIKNLALGAQYQGHQFSHIYYSQWPDKKVPSQVQHIEKLVEQISKFKRIVVHCSAGLGRSGVVAAILLILNSQQFQQKRKLSIFGTVRKMREYRFGAIQNSQQYKFLYQFFSLFLRNFKPETE